MPSFYITARKISPLTPLTVDAETREAAVQQVVDSAAEGEAVEVTNVKELPPGTSGGATGATGASRSSHKS